MEILSVTKVFDDGRHNAFTDLYYWAGSFYLAFRAGSHRHGEDGRIRILRSADAVNWLQTAEVVGNGDCRTPKLLAVGEQLRLYTTVVPERRIQECRDFVSVTHDGADWSDLAPVGPTGLTFWRPRIHGQQCYVAAYEAHEFKDPVPRRSVLLRSGDGLSWEEISTIYSGSGAGETELWFERDDRITALVCVDSDPGCAIVANSQPPYRNWKLRSTDRHLETPMLRKVYRRYLVAGGILDAEGNRRTALLWLQGSKLKLDALLPSGGDTSHPGCCWLNEDELLLSYHSSHESAGENSAAIYLARLGFDF